MVESLRLSLFTSINQIYKCDFMLPNSKMYCISGIFSKSLIRKLHTVYNLFQVGLCRGVHLVM